jgi:sulfoxide reductase heme-binding subunit YedZ
MSPRLVSRLWRHHLPLGLISAATVWLLYVSRDYSDVLTRLSFATAYPALALLAVTLIIGPWRTLSGKSNAISLDLRRDIGIWAGLLGVLHAGFGQFVHLRGRPWLYYIYEKWNVMPVRYDMFGFSNDTGLIATLLLLALLATSNDLSLRKLGMPDWKRLQRWNYVCFGLTALHTFGYLLGIKALKPSLIATAALFVGAAATLQYLGWRRRRAI